MSPSMSMWGPVPARLKVFLAVWELWGHLETAIAAPLATQMIVLREMSSAASRVCMRSSVIMRLLFRDLAAASARSFPCQSRSATSPS